MIKQKIYKRAIVSMLCIVVACFSAAIIGVFYSHADVNVEEYQNTGAEGGVVKPYIYTPVNNYGAVNLGSQRIKEGEYKTANLYYIKNANYFLANPKHHDNDGSDNENGTCTTVATQMLLGYHNYYSDRRLIPETDENGVRFLSEDYSDLEQHPDIMPLGNKEADLGRASIGTEDTVYGKIFDIGDGGSSLGQAIPIVLNAATRFLTKYADPAVNWNLEWGSGSADTVQAELFADKPIVLGFDFLLTGLQSTHVVVAYGYAEIDGKPGYITHYGWGKNYTQVWVPAGLIGFKMTMSIDHTHIYPNSGIKKTDTYRKVKCSVCGADLLENVYDLNRAGDTIIGCNFALTGAVTVPSQINGITIKSIDDFVFENQNISSINIPSSITNIGTNAFKNCKSLTTVTASNLQQIGESAFENCTGLFSVPIDKVQQIGNAAFNDCYKLTNIGSLDNVQSIGADSFKGCSSLSSINIPSGLLNIGDRAFSGCNNLNITVSSNNPSYSADGNILYDKNKTKLISAGNIAPNINILDSVTEVAPYAFDGNNKLTTLHIKNRPAIGQYAFANCGNLKSAYFYSYDVPSMGANAFLNDNFTIYVPHSKQPSYNSAFVGYTNSIASIPIKISYVSEGQNIETKNTYFGATITGLTVPFKLGYDFSGWYDNASFNGTEYTNGGLWDTTENMTVYAKWTPKKFYIIFDGTGSEDLADKEVTYDAPIGPLPVIEREGYEFAGWKNSRGEYYTEDTIWKDLYNVTLTSDVFSASYTVVLDKQGGTGGSDRVNPIYLTSMPSATPPTRTGYTFQGYFTEPEGKGTKYYNSNMTSAKNWDLAEDRTLYAYWIGDKYTITLDNQYTENFGKDLTSIASNDYKYISFIANTSGTITLWTSHTQGDPYLALYDTNFTPLKFSDDDYGNKDAKITYSVVSGNRYIVGFRAFNSNLTVGQVHYSGISSISYSNIYTTVEVTFGSNMMTKNIPTPARIGYTFLQYNTDPRGQGTSYYYGPNIASDSIWDRTEDTTLYAIWEKNYYNITLNLGYTSDNDSIAIGYKDEVIATNQYVFNRIGYDFKGFYSEPNGKGIKYFDYKISN